MAVTIEIPEAATAPSEAAIWQAQYLRKRAQASGRVPLATRAAGDIAGDIEALAAGDDQESIKAAAELLWGMSEAERMEALNLDEDDPKSYLAAVYSPAA
ncbi:hypothetical protein [Arthrobacter sp. 162MFSha1.1]|uniref:hypothetical protein n=1 Tax=Arthrobacter sp. 162MFSha1.1 TaxID=1151119 RepID=UPI000372C2BE|nr:hypothetical protein [Arthrobacter sp. 162MFSha1.1]